jgi:hypothetical protein
MVIPEPPHHGFDFAGVIVFPPLGSLLPWCPRCMFPENGWPGWGMKSYPVGVCLILLSQTDLPSLASSELSP